MIELFEQDERSLTRGSSKGNQLKWHKDGWWHKADYTGYEGLSEYVVARLLEYSNLKKDEYILYETEEIKYKRSVHKGVKSAHFLKDGWQLVTLERLFESRGKGSLYKAVHNFENVEDRFVYLVKTVEEMTGLKNFGIYLTKALELDAFFLNEDRHMHNIAVIMSDSGECRLCPLFDNGAALLSDTTMDYPLGNDIYELISEVKSKTISSSFDEQLEVVEKLNGNVLKFNFTKKDVEEILAEEKFYSVQEKERVRDVIFEQMRKYRYMFE